MSGGLSELDSLPPSVQESDEEEEMTAAEVLQKLEEAWVNERLSPDLLNCQEELVECMLDQLVQMEELAHKLKKGDVKLGLVKMEIDRVRYVIASYLRCRIKKIEQFCFHLKLEEENQGEGETSRLSAQEQTYLKDYCENMKSHVNTVVLRHMPPNLQAADEKKLAISPNLDSFVFFRVKRDVLGVIVEDQTSENRDEEIDLESGSQHLMRYRPVAHLLRSGALSLI